MQGCLHNNHQCTQDKMQLTMTGIIFADLAKVCTGKLTYFNTCNKQDPGNTARGPP
jgi:hypothetical protein